MKTVLDGKDRDIVVQLINWVLNDLEVDDSETLEEQREMIELEEGIRRLAKNMGLKNLKEVNDGYR
jgi:hypothetical protein